MVFAFFSIALLFSVSVACKPKSEELAKEQALGFENSLTSGSQIGLKPMEVALTLDDGPVPESLALAKKLRDLEVPVAYFMIGTNIQRYPQVTKEIAGLKFNSGPLAGQPATIISNHSWDHKRKINDVACIVCDGTEYASMEIKRTDDLIAPYVNAAKKPFFFRAPGGNFFRREHPDEVKSLNEINKTLSKYIGPFFWDVSGDVEPVCEKINAEKCGNHYLNHIRSKGPKHGIIILAHDIHEKTRQMLLGTDKWPGLISIMKKEGYKFVHLDKYPAALSKFGPVQNNEFGEISVRANKSTDRTFFIEASARNAVRIEVFIDRLQQPLMSGSGGKISGRQLISQGGQRLFQVKGYDANNKLIALGSRLINFPN